MATKKSTSKKSSPQVSPVRSVAEDVEVFVGGSHEYTYVHEVEQPGDIEFHTLYYAKSSAWDENIQGREAMSIIDDGWKYTIGIESGVIDYSDAEALKILLNIVQKEPPVEFYRKVDLHAPLKNV